MRGARGLADHPGESEDGCFGQSQTGHQNEDERRSDGKFRPWGPPLPSSCSSAPRDRRASATAVARGATRPPLLPPARATAAPAPTGADGARGPTVGARASRPRRDEAGRRPSRGGATSTHSRLRPPRIDYSRRDPRASLARTRTVSVSDRGHGIVLSLETFKSNESQTGFLAHRITIVYSIFQRTVRVSCCFVIASGI